MFPSHRIRLGASLALLAVAGSVLPLRSAVKEWDGGSTSGNWSAAANWNPAGAPVDGDELLFPAGLPAADLLSTNDIVDLRVALITFDGAGGGYFLRGLPITLTNGILAMNSVGVNTVVLDITNGAPQTHSVTVAAGSLTVSGTIRLNGFNLTFDNVGSCNAAGIITGAGNIVKNGTGTLLFSGLNANTYVGNTTVNAGTLQLFKAINTTAIPGDLFVGDGVNAGDTVQLINANQIANASDVSVNTNALLDLNNQSDQIGALALLGGTVDTGTGILTLGGNVTNLASSVASSIIGNLSLGSATRVIGVANASPLGGVELSIPATITGAAGVGLIKAGTGLMDLAGTNTYPGLTTVTQGVLRVFSDGGLGTTAAGTVVNVTALLNLTGAAITNESLILNAASANNVAFSGSASIWNGSITLNTDVAISAGTLELAGVISGPGDLTFFGGTITLSGPSSNNYTGLTRVNSGTVLLNKTPFDGAIPRDLIIGDGSGTDVVRHLRLNQIANTSDVTINTNGLLHLEGGLDGISDLVMTGGKVDTTSATATNVFVVFGTTVTINASTVVSVITGRVELAVGTTITVADGAADPCDLQIDATIATGSIIKAGPGRMCLNESNAFTGAVTINAGLVRINDNFALGTLAGGTTVNAGGGLEFDLNADFIGETLTLNGSGPDGTNALILLTGGVFCTNVVFASDTVINHQSPGNVFTFPGAVTGPGGFTKYGTGTLTFSGATPNNYGGVTRVFEGTLALSKSVVDGAIPGDLLIGDGAGAIGSDVVLVLATPQIATASDITIASSGLLDLNDVSEGIGTLSSASVNARVDLGAAGTGHLLVNGNAPNTTYTGLITGTGNFTKNGTATFTLTGNNTFIGNITINNGALLVNGSQSQNLVTINGSGTLGGSGTVGHITSAAGNIAPGASPGVLTCSNVVFTATGDFFVELNGLLPGTGHDQLNSRGTNNLANATLHVTVGPGFPPVVDGQRFTILTNDGAEAITSQFAGLPQGATLTAGGLTFRILYNGGSGNDVQLAVTNLALRFSTGGSISGGNGNNVFDPNECDSILSFTLTNVSGAPVTGISATLVPLTPGVCVTQPFSDYPDMAAGGRTNNLQPFQVSLTPGFLCGTNVSFELVVATATHGSFRIPLNYGSTSSGGPGAPMRFDNNSSFAIPDLGMVDSVINVAGIDTPLREVVVSLHITHGTAEDLDISLISPSGVTINLSSDNGGTSDDYGTGCLDGQRTVFDSTPAFPSITGGVAPFVGTFAPEVSLQSYFGDFGPEVNGPWTLRVADDAGGSMGTLRCWSLFLTPTVCAPGTGPCESCPERTIFGSISAHSQVQPDRLTRDGIKSACGVNKPCPGEFPVGPRLYDAYTFENGESNACITVKLTAECDLFSAAYTNAYDTNDLCANYLADMGLGTGGFEGTNSYSFNVGPRARFVVVVNQVFSTDLCPYRLEVTGGSCRPWLNITPISGNRAVLDWTTAAIGYGLERTNPLAISPPTVWLSVPTTPVIINSRFHVTNTVTPDARRFYWLRKP